MPAVKVYSFNAALAIAFNFILQMSAFLAVLFYDLTRIRAGRPDLLCCFKSCKQIDAEKKTTLSIDRFFKEKWTPFLLKNWIRPIVITFFITITCASIGVAFTKTRVGLDQDLSVPEASYVKKFFEYQEEYLQVGTPIYFVVKGDIDYQETDIQNAICSTQGCNAESLAQYIFLASKDSEFWKIETPSQSWLDDFIDWSSGSLIPKTKAPCCNCRQGKESSGILPRPSDPEYFCESFEDFCPANNPKNGSSYEKTCQSCLGLKERVGHLNRPFAADFYKFLDFFLRDNPGAECAKSGHAAYSQAVHFTNQYSGNTTLPYYQWRVDASSFMTYESVCIASEDCTENVVKARLLAGEIEKMIHDTLNLTKNDVEVFPYTLYTPYFEIYDTMGTEGSVEILLCFIPIFIIATIFLGFNFIGGAVVTIVSMMILINTAAICAFWDVQFNRKS